MERAGARPCAMFALMGICMRGWRCALNHARHAHSTTQRERELASRNILIKRHENIKANLKRVEQEVKGQYVRANALDLVIAMDCTGSMASWIDQAKRSLLGIIDSVKTNHEAALVRFGFVAYRDFCDGELRIQSHWLTEDIASVRDFIARLRAFGGGDGPEDIAGGLEAALAMDMTAAAKRLILVADAPCHGQEYHTMADDATYLPQIRASPCMRQQMRTLAARGIDVTVVEIVPEATAKMVAILQAEYEAAALRDGNGLDREFCKVSLPESGGVVRFPSVVVSSASSSIAASKMRSVLASSEKALGVSSLNYYGPSSQALSSRLGGVTEDDDYVEITPLAPLDWTQLELAPEVVAVRHSYHFRHHGGEINWARPNLKHSTQETTIKLLPACFARGAMRAAHAMFDLTLGKRFVAKVYYGRAACDAKRGAAAGQWSLANDVQAQVVAKRLAVEFSLALETHTGVDFIFTSWYEVADPQAAGLSAAMATFTAEPHVAGEYRKYNNNNGWISKHGGGGAAALRDTTQAFSHFTWMKTLGQLMVVDLQGVGSCAGRGDLSEAGMAAFFYTHKCNAVCESLGLLPFGEDADLEAEAEAAKMPPEATTTDADGLAPEETKAITCSCPLCGEIFVAPRNTFVDRYSKGREVYYDDCAANVAVREPRECAICEDALLIAPYWCTMKGIKSPTTCKKCKAVATQMKRQSRGATTEL